MRRDGEGIGSGTCMGFIVVNNLLVYSTIQYSAIVIIVYHNKCHRKLPQYIMSYSVVHKNVTILYG